VKLPSQEYQEIQGKIKALSQATRRDGVQGIFKNKANEKLKPTNGRIPTTGSTV
jgi:hypothetical protein